MAEGTEAPSTPSTTDRSLANQPDEPIIELSERGRALIEETAELVVELPD